MRLIVDGHQHIHKILFDDSQRLNDLYLVLKDEQHQNFEIVCRLLCNLMMKDLRLVLMTVQVIEKFRDLVVQLINVFLMFDLNKYV